MGKIPEPASFSQFTTNAIVEAKDKIGVSQILSPEVSARGEERRLATAQATNSQKKTGPATSSQRPIGPQSPAPGRNGARGADNLSQSAESTESTAPSAKVAPGQQRRFRSLGVPPSYVWLSHLGCPAELPETCRSRSTAFKRS